MPSPAQRSPAPTSDAQPRNTDRKGADSRGLLDLLRSVKRSDGTVQLSHGQRGAIVHALRTAGEVFQKNAAAIRAEISVMLEGSGLATHRLIAHQDLAAHMDRQAKEAYDAADLLEDCVRFDIELSDVQLAAPAGGGQ